MKTKYLILILLTVLQMSNAKEITNTKLNTLKCEHLFNPLGIDNPHPRFSWMIEDKRIGAKQTAFQLFVDTDSVNVVENKGQYWDTGKIISESILETYAGKPLNPFTKYFWKLISWNQHGIPTTSEIATFETGVMQISNWEGHWISDHHDIHFKPAPYFRKKFNCKKTVKAARAYIAVAGLYELYLNGEKIGNHRLDPMYTRFDRRNLYVTYDVTHDLLQGDNVMGIVLGNGWYNHQSLAVWDFEKAPWRNRPAFCLDLRITYTDGSTETIGTGLDWKTSVGPIIMNSIYTGEHYDARLEETDWCKVSYDDSAWNHVRYRSVPSKIVTAQQLHPIRNVQEFEAQSVNRLNDSTYLFDFGQNMSGVTKINVQGKEGVRIQIKHGERLNAAGYLDLSNIDVYYRGDGQTDPFQTDILILSGRQTDEFMPKFNYKGFRYVELISSEPMHFTKDNLKAYFMHSDVPSKGSIKTSNPLIDKLCRATNNAYLSNLMGLPTDCPQREKNGWTGDGHFAIETALYNFDGITIYEKWLADHRDEQQPNGVLPDIIPTGGWGYGSDNGLDWTSTIAIIPWEIYMFYGDSKLLRDSYPHIKRYVNYVNHISPNHLTTWGRGDWVPVKTRSNKEFTSSVYYYVVTQILADAALLFGQNEDYQQYTALSEKIKTAINNKYLNQKTGIYAGGSQTELSMALYWKIVPDAFIEKTAGQLVEKVKDNQYHLDVGVLGAKALLNALSENGHAEAAYKVAVQDSYPSWGWWIVNGATTLLENWDLDAKRDISDNHMMFGEIGAWFYKGLGGIFPDPECPGFKHIILRPNFIKELKEFEACHQSPYGKIISKWTWKKSNIHYQITVPANSTATLYLPDYVKGQREIQLEAGEHILKLSLN